MGESLRDQLLRSGLAQQLKPARLDKPAVQKGKSGQPAPPRPPGNPPARADIDLATAYALRHRDEARERQRLQREQEEKARAKKERKQKLAAALAGKSLNATDADVARHFPHRDKICRVYVTADQLVQVNRGELGVVQHAGRFQIIAREVAVAVQAIDPDALLLLVDPDQPADDDVPADLVW